MPRHIEGKLTVKQTRFCKEYIKSGNGAQSAIKAGYSKKAAKELAYETLTIPHVKAKIESIMSKEAEELGLNAKYVLEKLKRISDLEITRNEKIASSILKSIELEGKHLKLFHDTEKVIDMRLSEHKNMIEKLAEDITDD